MLKYQKAWKKKVKSGKAVNYSLRAFKIWLALLLLVIIFALWYQWELDHPVEIVSPVPSTGYVRRLEVKKAQAVEPYLEGMATWYGTGETECLGCNSRRIMANGQPLDDTKLTVACGVGGSCKQFPLKSKIKIINQANGMTVYATVTDTGGFQQGKYAKMGRILDVSKAVRDSLNMAGMTKVRVYLIKI
jgi:rare lipoprotein A (peptidoglycan hydrolase)